MAENPYESPEQLGTATARFPGPSAWAVIGALSLTLGVLLVSLATRICWLNWAAMSEETRNRVIVFSVVGGLLIMSSIGSLLWSHRNRLAR